MIGKRALRAWLPVVCLAVGCASSGAPRSAAVAPVSPGAGASSSGAAVDAAAPPPPPWERIREEDGIVVDRREIPGSPVIAFRGEGVVQAPLLRVASVIVDVGRSVEWVSDVKEARELRRLGEDASVNYSHVKTPPLITDRDFVLQGKLVVLDAGKRVEIRVHSVDDASMPPGRYVRGEVMDSSFALIAETPTSTRVICEIHADPKGALPTWLVNLVQRGWAVKTLRALREQVKKSDVVDPPWLQQRLTVSADSPVISPP